MSNLEPVFLQTLIDAIPAPIFYKDANERYLGCNATFERSLGLSKDRILGRTVYDIAPKSLADVYHQKDQELLLNPGIQVYEASVMYADGKPHEVTFHKATFANEAGETGGLIGVILDISERKHAESRLAETLDLVRKVVAAAPTGITVFRADTGRCILCNPAMAAIIGGEIDQILTHNFRSLDSWKSSGMLAAAERVLATGEDQRLEAHITTAFGKAVWISCVFTAFASGDEKHLLLLVNDVTDQRRAEEAQRGSESRYRTLTEKMGEGLISTDAEGRFTYCNPKFLRTMGYRMDEVLGRTFFALTHDYTFEKWQARLGERRQGAAEQYELQLRHRDGSPVDVLVSAEPLFNQQGEFTGTLGIITDIRDRKRNEATLRQAHKVEGLTVLAGGIAHDFNNLFQAIQGNLEMASEMLSDPDRARRALKRALLSLDKANTLSQRMLDYSGKSSRKSIPMDLAELVRMHSTLFSNLTHPGTKINYHLQSGLPPIDGDPEQLLQVLTALITNADEALEGMKGSITISVEEFPEALRSEGFWIESPPLPEALMLSVSDTGCGTPPQTLGRLFDPFFTTKEAGRGLGLASTLGILKGHQAGLQVLSEPGKGSTFRIAFAVRPSALEPAVPLSASAIISQRKGFVLLVDDDPGVRATGSEILTDFLHYQVLEARDGREAVAVFQQNADAICVILMDATMPNMTGSEAFQVIKALRPDAKAILCSGYSDETGHKLMKEYGFLGFLKKPYSIKDLKEALENAINA